MIGTTLGVGVTALALLPGPPVERVLETVLGSVGALAIVLLVRAGTGVCAEGTRGAGAVSIRRKRR